MVVILKLKPSWAVCCLTAAEDFVQSPPHWPRLPLLWARAFGAGVVGLALSATTTADVPAPRLRPAPSLMSASDPRIARLENFFHHYHCPKPYHTSEYLRAADGHGLDYRLLPAISIRETLCGTAELERHNHWGYHPGGDGFPSIEVGIDFLARRLTQHPYYKGKSLQDKLFTYNPRQAYPDQVKRIMRQIE